MNLRGAELVVDAEAELALVGGLAGGDDEAVLGLAAGDDLGGEGGVAGLAGEAVGVVALELEADGLDGGGLARGLADGEVADADVLGGGGGDAGEEGSGHGGELHVCGFGGFLGFVLVGSVGVVLELFVCDCCDC